MRIGLKLKQRHAHDNLRDAQPEDRKERRKTTDMSVATNDADDWETTSLAPVVARQPAAPPTRNGSSTTVTDDDADDMDAATSSFSNLRLVPPPPSQDGGAFDRVDPFQRNQQPSPQHALFDPNGNYAQPVSPATATAAVARFGPLDPVLLAALENSRERLTLLKFEDQIVRFIKNPREMQLNFPPLSSYHRLIIHRLAERCYLEHQTADFNTTYVQGYDGNASRVVTLFKTAQTVVPRVLLIDLSAEKQQQAVTPASAPKIMVRKRNASRGAGNANGGRGGQDAKNQQRSIEDRERAYAEARARIFGENSSSSTDTVSSTSTSADSTIAPSTSGQKLGNSVQAAGPDGSRGFGRGGGRGNGGSNGNSPAQSRQQQDSSNKGGRGGNNSTQNVNKQTAAASTTATGSDLKAQQNWKESKVLWRNREQELNDPDFTRNHDAYRPSRDQHYGGGNNGGRFGNNGSSASGNHFYDGPRSYGYQSAPQPPFPGRGRGPPPNEYSRIDPMQRSMQPPPPPPPPADYYRQHPQHPGQIHAPPPPPGAFHNAYSPHGRGGYGNPPPPSSAQQQPLRRGSAGAPVGGYNEAFPPLGK